MSHTYNELVRIGYNVDIRIVQINKIDEQGNNIKSQYEVDFMCNIYIFNLHMKCKIVIIEREFKAYKYIEDNYLKYVISLDKI